MIIWQGWASLAEAAVPSPPGVSVSSVYNARTLSVRYGTAYTVHTRCAADYSTRIDVSTVGWVGMRTT